MLSTDGFALEPAKLAKTPVESPYLIFIHGVASSTWGSFGDLWHKDRRVELNAIRGEYGDRVLAFEHASLTCSPIENALELVKLLKDLPVGTRLHLITHSGGGLVGELLCRGGALETMKKPGRVPGDVIEIMEPFCLEEFKLFEGEAGKYQGYSEQLKELGALLQKKRFNVERFVRVACPALGTSLASGRLDHWFSIIGSIGAAALSETPLADAFKDMGDFITTVIGKRIDPSTLPGLEAMMPESAVINLINWPGLTVSGDLMVISGDIEPEAKWAKSLVWATDRFFDGNHDMAVNTLSMYGGAKRSGRSLVSFHRGPEVNHFRYLKNQSSAQAIVKALTAEDSEVESFEPLRKPTVDIYRAVIPRTTDPMPVVFVLPGIMGSELEVEGNLIWPDIPNLFNGKFRYLSIDSKNVRPLRPFARYYGELIEYLTGTHKVVPFPFDWRLPIEAEADRLAGSMAAAADEARRQRQPLRILAHSMGGLIARTMIARHEGLWKDLCKTPGARLVMLGTPNSGSHAVTELLMGRSSILRQLAFLDTVHSTRDLLTIIARFPGLLAMLPKDNREDYFALETWKSYHKYSEGKWILPQADDLSQAYAFRQLYDNAPIDSEHMVYVAGCAEATIVRMYLDPNAKDYRDCIQFDATSRGDGRVTWESGIPPGLPVWYMENVGHGDLPAYEPGFKALLDLLQKGGTSLLPRTPPVSRAAENLFPMPRKMDDLYPDEDVIAGTAIGASPHRHRHWLRRERAVAVRVVHGNLMYARHPVAVGHYAGDTIISAEKSLDAALEGLLRRRHQIGIYPDALGTSAIFINPRLRSYPSASPRGAIVVGLGTVGPRQVKRPAIWGSARC